MSWCYTKGYLNSYVIDSFLLLVSQNPLSVEDVDIILFAQHNLTLLLVFTGNKPNKDNDRRITVMKVYLVLFFISF
jgi:hypothetical protein